MSERPQMEPEEMAALGNEVLMLVVEYINAAAGRGLPRLGFTIIAAEIGMGHVGYASTIDRADSMTLLRHVLRNMASPAQGN